MAAQTAQYDHIGSNYDEYARTATEKRAERYTFFRMVGALEGGLSRADGFPYDVSRTSVSSHPWVGTSALVQVASSGEGIRGGLDARRSRCKIVCDTGGLETPIPLSSLRPHTGGSTP